METVLLGGLGYLGNRLNNERKDIKCKPNYKKVKQNRRKVSSQNISKRINQATKKQAKELKKCGFASQFDTIMLDNTGGPVACNQANTINIHGTNSYDISLQRDIDFRNGYSEFSKTQMHYDVVPQIEMMTSNMNKHSSRRDMTRQDKNHSRQLALHTGVDPYYMSKDTHDPIQLFEPMKDLTYVHGAPVMTELLEQRYVPSYKNNDGDLPFAHDLKVAPGLFGEPQEGRNEVYRILPKCTDDLRSKTNQKVTYEAEKVVAVQRGQYRPAPQNLTKFKLPTHREKTMDDYLPNSGTANKHKKTGKFQKINTNRSTSMNVVGTVYEPTKGVKETGKFIESGKITYADDAISRAVSNVTTKPVSQNKKSYRNIPNERDTTNQNIPGVAHNVTEGSYALNPKDIPLTTLRQLMIDGDNNIGVTQNKNKNTYVFSKDCVIPETHRSITTTETKEGMMNPIVKETIAFNSEDKARQTIRQTTGLQTVAGPLNPIQKETNYYNDNDRARQTIRETTEQMTVVGSLNPEKKESNYFNNNDAARQTVRETTGYMTVAGSINPEMKEGHYYNDNDIARQTIKETTILNNIEGVINPEMKEGHYFNDNDIARSTIKQTTSTSNVEAPVQPTERAPVYINYEDTPALNIRNTTTYAEYISNANRTHGNNQYMYNTKDKARPTIRYTTGLAEYVSNTNRAEGNNPYMYNSKDEARPTIRYTTGLSKYISNANRSQGNVVIDKCDKARPTIKETTLFQVQEQNTNRTTQGNVVVSKDDTARPTIRQTTTLAKQDNNVSRTTQGNVVISKDNKPRPTIKSTTLHTTPGGRVGRAYGGETYARDKDDEARQTVKETTLHTTPGGRVGRAYGGEAYARDKDDEARQTIRQTTLHSTQGGRLGRTNGGETYARDEKDKARVTIRQTTLLQNHTGPLKGEVEKKISQEAAHNMSIDERREILTYNRPAGPKSDKVGPIMNKNNVKLKEENFIKRTNYGFDKSNCNLGQLNKTFTRNKEILNTTNYRINNDFINTLQNNPLVNDIMHQKNVGNPYDKPDNIDHVHIHSNSNHTHPEMLNLEDARIDSDDRVIYDNSHKMN